MQHHDALPPFHLAFPVDDLQAARDFYCNILGCGVGRSSDTWIDFNLHGHQVVAHQQRVPGGPVATQNIVDGKSVPVPHFGVVLPWHEWHEFAGRLRAKQVEFVIAPYIRFEGLPGEQATLFIRDPAGNVLEFKSFRQPEQLFAD